jgi:hypothetical protein
MVLEEVTSEQQLSLLVRMRYSLFLQKQSRKVLKTVLQPLSKILVINTDLLITKKAAQFCAAFFVQ